jgi:hypothetical protein
MAEEDRGAEHIHAWIWRNVQPFWNSSYKSTRDYWRERLGLTWLPDRQLTDLERWTVCNAAR